MDFFDRIVSKVQRSGTDKPIDVTQAIRQAMDRGATPMSRDRTVAPNHFEISLPPATDAAFEQWGKDALLQEFVRDANAYATEQNYSLVGSVYVEFTPLNPEQRRLEVRARSVSGAVVVSSSPSSPATVSSPGSPATAPHRGPGSQSPAEPNKATFKAPASPAMSSPTPTANAGEHDPVRPGTMAAKTDSPQDLSWKPLGANEEAASHATAPGTNRSNPEAEILAKNEQKPLLEVVGGQTYLLVGERSVIGRGANVDIALSDSGVSHRHFEIVEIGSNYVLRDLGSTNGTFVEGNRVNEATLLDRNVITAGRVKMIFWRQAQAPTGARI